MGSTYLPGRVPSDSLTRGAGDEFVWGSYVCPVVGVSGKRKGELHETLKRELTRLAKPNPLKRVQRRLSVLGIPYVAERVLSTFINEFNEDSCICHVVVRESGIRSLHTRGKNACARIVTRKKDVR